MLYNLHIETDNFHVVLEDADAYLKLAPNRAMADKLRKMRDQLQKALPEAARPSGAASLASPAAPNPTRSVAPQNDAVTNRRSANPASTCLTLLESLAPSSLSRPHLLARLGCGRHRAP
jgi:hypothetical protein